MIFSKVKSLFDFKDGCCYWLQRSSTSPDRALDRSKLGRSRSRSPEMNSDASLKRRKTEEKVGMAVSCLVCCHGWSISDTVSTRKSSCFCLIRTKRFVILLLEFPLFVSSYLGRSVAGEYILRNCHVTATECSR